MRWHNFLNADLDDNDRQNKSIVSFRMIFRLKEDKCVRTNYGPGDFEELLQFYGGTLRKTFVTAASRLVVMDTEVGR